MADPPGDGAVGTWATRLHERLLKDSRHARKISVERLRRYDGELCCFEPPIPGFGIGILMQ
jgi:hypothetical protein